MKKGDLVRWANEQDGGPVHRVTRAFYDGMIELHDMTGFFANHLFVLADDIGGIPLDDHAIVAQPKHTQTSDAELLPCPFCGGEAKREDIEAREGVENAGASYITCARCWASTALHFDRKENLISSWNDRRELLPKWRCDHCDNGIEFEWEFCAWCGASENWKTAELDVEECGNHSEGSPP